MIVPHPQKTRYYGLKALPCMRIAFPYTMCETENKWMLAELFKMNAKVMLSSNFVVDYFLDTLEA